MKPVDPGVRVAVATPSVLGESPFWHPGERVLYYVDIVGRQLRRFDPAGGESRHWDFETDVSCPAPMLGNRLLLGLRNGLWRFDPVSGERTRLVEPPYDPARERFNDGKCDPAGRFWVGTVYEPRQPPLGSLSVWSNGRLEREFGGVTTLNGLGWSPDGATMYWSDTRIGTIFRADYDLATGTLSARREFARFPDKRPDQPLDDYGGRPDGAAVDTEGCYWVAMFEGQRVVKLSPSGEILREVVLPARCPTMPCFGGADLKTLYVTSSRENRPAEELAETPYAGCVFAFEVEVPGLPVNFVR